MATHPKSAALPPPPTISVRTMLMSGLLVDVYGLEELSPTATRITCLWLHHQRTRRKEAMASIAARCASAWNAKPGSGDRGLIALAFDHRNHGTRMVHELANADWAEGNPTHAQDMFALLVGAVADQAVLIDVVGSYLFPDHGRAIDRHLALGVSVGGHSVWQTMFAEPRIRAAVVVIGCPDIMYLLSQRAKNTGLATYPRADEAGAAFLGGRDFPPSLVDACRKFDPKGILFATSEIPKRGSPVPGRAGEAVRQKVKDRISGKKFLICSGGADELVPYRCSEPFLAWFKDAAGTWLRDCDITVEDIVYPGVGHRFDWDMIKDAVRFVADNVEERSGVAAKI